MEGFSKKFTAVILTAVLSFVLLVPVPIGNVAIDRGRFSQAHATAAIPAGWAIWGTAAALAGLYICATTDADYVTAVQQAYDDFLEAIGSDEATFTPLMLEYYNETDGTIDFNSMYAELFGDDFVNYANGMLENGTAVINESSTADGTIATIQGHSFTISNAYPAIWNSLVNLNDKLSTIEGYNYFGYTWYPDGAYVEIAFVPANYLPKSVTTVNYTGHMFSGECLKVTPNTNTNTWHCQYMNDVWRISSITNSNSNYRIIDGHSVVASASYINSTASNPLSLGGYPLGVSAAISSALAAGLSSIPAGTYGVFQPTTAQLEAGFDAAAVLQAISSAGGAISDDLTGLAGTMSNMLGQMTGLADSVTSLAGMVSQLVASNAALQAWAGAGSFGNVMNTVIDDLGDISGGIEAGVSDILDGLADIPGADVLSPSIDQILADIELLVDPVAVDIPGAIEGVLEGVLDIPGAIEVGAVNVVDAVNAMSLDIAGVIEGVMEPFMQQFRVPESDGTPVAVPMGITDGLAAAFEDKVPFCYVIRSSAALQRMFANFSQSRSFYFDVTLPFTEETVTFDGEIFLSQPFGVSDIASTIKVILTALICFGLLWRSYKIIERAVL